MHTDAAQAPEKTRLNASISRIGRWQATPYLDTDDGFLAADASVHNPVDMIASAGPAEYAACIDALMVSDEIDALMTIFIPPAPEGAEEIAVAIRDAAFEHAFEMGDELFETVFNAADGVGANIGNGARFSQLPRADRNQTSRSPRRRSVPWP